MSKCFEEMPIEEHETNIEDHRRSEINIAKELRAEANEMIREAKRIERFWKQDSRS